MILTEEQFKPLIEKIERRKFNHYDEVECEYCVQYSFQSYIYLFCYEKDELVKTIGKSTYMCVQSQEFGGELLTFKPIKSKRRLFHIYHPLFRLHIQKFHDKLVLKELNE